MEKYYSKDGIDIYNCDNIELLKSIDSNSVDLIYSDILYNTRKNFDDYNDNLGSSFEAIEWYRPRFIEMKRILKDNGSIYIHCNWRLDSYIRMLLDEIFGEDCFKNRIYRKHSHMRSAFKNYDSQIDIILYYVKNKNDYTFNDKTDIKTKIVPLYENGSVVNDYELNINGKLINLSKINKHWLLEKSEVENMISKDEVLIIDNLPYRKYNTVTISNIWDEEEMIDNYSRVKESNSYDTPKPLAVLERIINISSNEGDTVADFFLGGGTTAVVCKKLNRKGIFCDISKKACDTTIKKLNE